MQLSKPSLLEGVTGGALGVAILAIFISIVAFNGEGYYRDDKIGLEFGMELDPISQEIEIWMHAPRAFRIKTGIRDIMKVHTDGSQTRGGLLDLFPMGDGTTRGIGKVHFEILSGDEDKMPNLANMTQDVIPMAYISKAKELTGIRYLFALFVMGVLNNWGKFKFLYWTGSIFLILLGIRLRLKGKKEEVSEMELRKI